MDELEAGEALDAEIEHRLWGYEIGQDDTGWYVLVPSQVTGKPLPRIPRPVSTSIAAAWQVMEAMRERGWAFALWDVPAYSSIMRGPTAAFIRGVCPPDWTGRAMRGHVAADGFSDATGVCSAALAVCRASLAALAAADPPAADGPPEE